MSKKRKERIKWSKIKWGSLTRWLRKHEKQIRKRYGVSPFTKSGEINDRVLQKMKNDDAFLKKISKSHWKKIKKKIVFKLNVLRG